MLILIRSSDIVLHLMDDTMVTERPRHDDTGPFASLVHELVHGGPGPQVHDFKMRDTDVVLVIEAAKGTYRLLHLQNVRADTIVEARAAVDNFIDQLDPSDHPERIERTVFENFDKVCQQLREHVGAAKADVEDLWNELDWVEGNAKKRVRDESHRDDVHAGPSDDNPLAVVRAACKKFLKKLELIDDSGKPEKRTAEVKQEGYDKAHQEIREYMEARAEKRGLVFDWYEGTYPRETLRNTYSRIMYNVYFTKNGNLGYHSGTG